MNTIREKLKNTIIENFDFDGDFEETYGKFVDQLLALFREEWLGMVGEDEQLSTTGFIFTIKRNEEKMICNKLRSELRAKVEKKI